MYVYNYIYICDRIWQKPASTHTMARLTFHHHLINELNNPCVIIANGSLVCFSWGLFLKPVRRAWVLGWSLNGSDVTVKVPTWLEITTRLARKLGHQIGYYLWYLELEWASGETFWLGLGLICQHNFKNNR